MTDFHTGTYIALGVVLSATLLYALANIGYPADTEKDTVRKQSNPRQQLQSVEKRRQRDYRIGCRYKKSYEKLGYATVYFRENNEVKRHRMAGGTWI